MTIPEVGLSSTTTRRLVFGDDGSTSADVAWLWINNHTWPGWRLEVIAATGPFGDDSTNVDDPSGDRPAPRPPFAAAQFATVESSMPAQDPRLALSVAADLLVLGARGPGVLKALHLGSTSEWLIVRPPAPIVVVRHGRPTRRVLLACDGSTHSTAATDALCALPFVDQLQVTVVGVDDGVVKVDDAVAATESRLGAVCAGVEAQVLAGDPTQVLSKLAEQLRPDLLALGTRGHTGVKRLRLGATAYALTHRVDCSVLITRDRVEIDRDTVPAQLDA